MQQPLRVHRLVFLWILKSSRNQEGNDYGNISEFSGGSVEYMIANSMCVGIFTQIFQPMAYLISSFFYFTLCAQLV